MSALNNDLVEITCCKCGIEKFHIEKTVYDLFNAICCDKCFQAESKPVHIDPAEELIKRIIPSHFIDFDKSKYPEASLDAYDQTIKWEYQFRGLYLMGDTRKGKTRALMELLKSLIRNSNVRNIQIYWAGELKDKIIEVAGERERVSFKNKVKNCKLLVLDDVFNDSITDSLSSFLFSVIDSRINNRLPTIFTSNLNGEELRNLENGSHRANALYRRIKESTQVIWFK